MVIDNRITWAMHVDHVKKFVAQKSGHTYFKSILPAVTYGIMVHGNCSSSIMDSINYVQVRAIRVIYRDENVAKPNLHPISYNFMDKRRPLLLIHNVLNGKALFA